MYFKTGSFSAVSLLGVVKESKPFISKKGGKQYTSLIVETKEKYTNKEGEEKSSASEIRVFSEGVQNFAIGNVVLVGGEVGMATVKFKTELKYPINQIVVLNARVMKVADVADSALTGLNSFEIIGRVGREPKEIKGNRGCEFVVAISPKDMETIWVPIAFWGQRGVKLMSIVNKGDLVRITGRASLGLKKVGEEEKKVLTLFGTELHFLAKKKTEDSSDSPSNESSDSIEQTSIEDEVEDAPF